LREIAAEARVNYSLVYRYFRTKDALIAAVFNTHVHEIQAKFVEVPGGVEALRQVHYMHDLPGYARALAWAILEGTDLDLLFTDPEAGEDTSEESASHVAPLVAATTERDIQARIIVGSFLALAMGWDVYEPYLLRITGMQQVEKSVLNEHLARIADALLTLDVDKPAGKRTR
jgi:AcrR family transcriptional regulator